MSTARPQTLSTADLARMFSVTETTIKRWADSGDLPCEKTPGGHRKYRLSAVLSFAESRGFAPTHLPATLAPGLIDHETETAIIGRDIDALRKTFLQKARSGKQDELSSFLVALAQSNVSITKISDEIIDPCMEEIGNLWLSGEIGIETEHQASYEVLTAIAQIEAGSPHVQRIHRTAVLACPQNEHHEIGIRSLAGVLRIQGWDVNYLGANVPTDSIIQAINRIKPSVLCLSISRTESAIALQDDLRRVYAAVRQSGGQFLIGGAGVQDRFVEAQICDYVCHSARDLVALSHRLD